MLYSKQYVAWKIVTENKAFHFSKSALGWGTTCNEGLREALPVTSQFYKFYLMLITSTAVQSQTVESFSIYSNNARCF